MQEMCDTATPAIRYSQTKTYFPPEPNTDTTAQLEKKFLQPTRSECIVMVDLCCCCCCTYNKNVTAQFLIFLSLNLS
jgi:hypothetical protein